MTGKREGRNEPNKREIKINEKEIPDGKDDSFLAPASERSLG
jgi:hypothetical protein